ncbi:hypothetical protein T12_15579 [Trichinella patagoniensis]|uniref:Uncharacterized protein n=1 Tax=Trichinella patagoniensis TaxID=990121 RepID=A0A0V0Z7E8_9BILA|nr:hypothetical protein T12_15579 [Trichinella patagoniensis]
MIFQIYVMLFKSIIVVTLLWDKIKSMKQRKSENADNTKRKKIFFTVKLYIWFFILRYNSHVTIWLDLISFGYLLQSSKICFSTDTTNEETKN